MEECSSTPPLPFPPLGDVGRNNEEHQFFSHGVEFTINHEKFNNNKQFISKRKYIDHNFDICLKKENFDIFVMSHDH